MVALWILAALLAVYCLIGLGLLIHTSLRQKKADVWEPGGLDNSVHYKDQKHLVYGVREWMKTLDTEDLHIRSFDDLKLHGVLVKNPEARGSIILFHGYRCTWKLDFCPSIRFLYSLGYNLLLVDQRSHGESEGKWITYGVRESRDAQHWVTYVTQLFGEQHPIFIMGLSMGASTVMMAADMDLGDNVKGILADCGYTSAWDEMRDIFVKAIKIIPPEPFLFILDVFTRLFAGYGLAEKSTLRTLPNAKYPVFFVHGLADGFVPCYMTRQSYDACGSEKELYLVEGAEHGMSCIVESESYLARVKAFLEKYNK